MSGARFVSDGAHRAGPITSPAAPGWTPVLGYAVGKLDAVAGVMVTASHNEREAEWPAGA